MRSVLLVLFSLSFLPIIHGQTLNPYGHIVAESESQLTYELEFDNNHYHILYDHLKLLGNHLIQINNSLVTTDRTCSHSNSTLRIYDISGALRFAKSYTQIKDIELMIAQNALHFLNSGTRVLLDLNTLTETKYQGAVPLTLNQGIILHVDSENNLIHYNGIDVKLPGKVLDIKTDSNDNTYVFFKNDFLLLNDEDGPQVYDYLRGYFFEAKLIDGVVYWSEKNKLSSEMVFTLNTLIEDEIVQRDNVFFDFVSRRKNAASSNNQKGFAKEPIPCPLKPDIPDYPFQIGNSYGEYQNYGGFEYLHRGVDFFGEIAEPVYSVNGGIVKEVILEAGLYCQIVIDDGTGTDQGYLYIHLEGTTIPYVVGDEVKAGDYIGELVEWPIYDFHHLHFTRVRSVDNLWDGRYWTTDNVLTDITNFQDTEPPVFEPLWLQNTIALRSNFNEILSPDSLYGVFDIICHAHDKSNSDYRVEVHNLRFELWEKVNNQEPIYQQDAYNYDFELPAYFYDGSVDLIIGTIYSLDQNWTTLADYEEREFFQQVSRSNGDEDINELDFNTYFDSRLFPDGDYLIRIYAEDAAGNESYTDLAIRFQNGIQSNTVENSKLDLLLYPNPSSGSITIETEKKIQSYKIINSIAQVVDQVDGLNISRLNIDIKNKGQYNLLITTKNGDKIVRTFTIE